MKLAAKLCLYGLGESLYSAAGRYGEDIEGFRKYLHAWRNVLERTLRYDPKGFLGRKHRTLANAIPPDFPDPAVVLAYTSPLVTGVPTSTSYTRKAMDLRRLGLFCKYSFSFGGWEPTLAKLEKNLVSATITEALQQISRDKKFPRYLTGFIEIVGSRTRHGNLQFQVRTNCRLMVDLLHSGYNSMFITDLEDEREIMRRAWVHGYLLAYSHPRIVAQYYDMKNKQNPFQIDEVN